MGIFYSIAKALGFYRGRVIVKCQKCGCKFSAPSECYEKCLDCRWESPRIDYDAYIINK